MEERASGEASREGTWVRQLGEGIWEETSEKASGILLGFCLNA